MDNSQREMTEGSLALIAPKILNRYKRPVQRNYAFRGHEDPKYNFTLGRPLVFNDRLRAEQPTTTTVEPV